jgi:hypothetical protein
MSTSFGVIAMHFDLGLFLKQASAGTDSSDVHEQFRCAAHSAPPEIVSRGIAAMFRSGLTPPFGQIAARLFASADPGQKAAMLNELLAGIGPDRLHELASGASDPALATFVDWLVPDGLVAVTATQAMAVTAEQAAQIAHYAEKHAPGVVERMSSFYAGHPDLIQSLSGVAISIALAHMTDSHRS